MKMSSEEYLVDVDISPCPICGDNPYVYRELLRGWSDPAPLIHRIRCERCNLELKARLVTLQMGFESLEDLVGRWDNGFKRRDRWESTEVECNGVLTEDVINDAADLMREDLGFVKGD